MGRYQQYRPLDRAEGMAVSTWPDISHLSISKPALVNVLRQMDQHVKWPQKMTSPDSHGNPNWWCDFHNDHSHKTEDCIELRIEVNELLKKRHPMEFLSDKAKNLLNKDATKQSAKSVPASAPQQNRVIHVIFGGSKISGISHAAAKKSTRSAKNMQETGTPKRLLLGTDEISFTAKEQEKTLSPHHDAQVISLIIANFLVKRILVDNDSSRNIIFQTAYHDLGLEAGTLTWKVTPLIGFSGEVKQTSSKVTLPVYAEGINMSTKFLVVDCQSSYNMILGRPWIHDMGAFLQHFINQSSSLLPGASRPSRKTRRIPGPATRQP
ncbi:PREDICTED: uncharacterized protein LOC106338321 [Brassica oleracea var. oleracea]|uniref:uncharacterized protein LOC106338321 n=1 Tax=Brassica oleracea var. oleracea TaxID=109376 RepID=UPI0006A73A8E|nr:PREDICTED: uncharacterized protein LOC106338321 [Brassica oleracea var. oleracea]